MPRTDGATLDLSRSGGGIDSMAIRLPEGFALADASFVQSGSDLLVSSADGVDVLVRGFFANDPPPDLVSSSGVRVAGSLVAAVADEKASMQLGEALFGGGVHAIGQVSSVNGMLSVIHPDGTRDTLNTGDPIYPSDILEAGSDSTASIALGDSAIFSLGSGGRMILRPAAPGLGESGEPVTLAAGPGEYALAFGAAPQAIVVDTPAGQIHADGTDLVLSYPETGGLQIILIPGADGAVGDVWIENEAGSFQLTLGYQLVLVESAAKAPDPQGLLDSEDIIAEFGRILGSLPSSFDSNPLVAAARAAELEMADLAGEAGDLSQEDIQALAEFETAAGDEVQGDATFTDAKVIVTQYDPLAGKAPDSSAVQPLPADTWIRPRSNTDGSGSDARNPNETLISSGPLIEVDVQRFNFVDPPDSRPPVIANLSVADWDADLRQWRVIVPQEPSKYGKGIFYDKVSQYDEPRATVFRPQGPDDIETQYFPTSGGSMLVMSAGPLTGVTETGRGARIEFIEQGFFNMPSGTLPKDIDTGFLIDGAAMKASNSVAIGAGKTKTISFDWAFDARDEATFDDYAVFIVNGEWFKLSDNPSTGAFGSTGWRRSEFEYTAANQENLTIGFAVINDANNGNDPRLLIDNVRLNEPVPADYREIGGASLERGGTPLPGEAQLRTFARPPTAEADEISTSHNVARSVFAADLMANDSDPNALDALSVTGLNDSGTLGRVSFFDSDTLVYDPSGMFDWLAEGEQATDSFEYEVTNLSGITDVATVTVTITGVDDGGAGNGNLVEGFETPIDPGSMRGAVAAVFRYDEPDGAQGEFSPTDGNSMALLTASGSSNLFMEFFLGLSAPLPADFGDSSNPTDGAALKLTIDAEEGDQISFDWMFDANDFVQEPLGDFARPGFNDFAVFTADGEWFNLSDVRQVFNETVPFGATGWRTSIYTAQSEGPLTIGFAVVNDDTQQADSHLLVDNIRINKDFDPDSYTVVRSDPSGLLDTVVHNPEV